MGRFGGPAAVGGLPLNVPDGQIAATALEHSLTLVTLHSPFGLESVRDLKSLAKKWQLVEGVVTAIEHSFAGLPGTLVVPNAAVTDRNSKTTRQVDVYVSIPIGSRVLTIGIEVRDESAPVDITAIEQLNAKLSKLNVDRRCVVSASGFTKSARAEAARWGVELRTIAEVGVPDWWLPTTVEVEHCHIELLHVGLGFGPDTPDDVIEKMKGVAPGEFIITSATQSISLVDIVISQGLALINSPELQKVGDQESFSILIKLENHADCTLNYPSGAGPVPPSVRGTYRLHRTIKSVPIASYRMGGVEAFTFLPGFDDKQVTFVSELQGDGTRRVSLAVADATPRSTRVGPTYVNVRPKARVARKGRGRRNQTPS